MATALSSSTPAVYDSAFTGYLDAESERRWIAWQARGLAHDRAVRERSIVGALCAAVIVLAAVITYGLRSS